MDSNTVKLADVRPDLSNLEGAQELWKSVFVEPNENHEEFFQTSFVECNSSQIKRLRNEILVSEYAQMSFCNRVAEIETSSVLKPHIQIIRAECYRKLLNNRTLDEDTFNIYIASAINCYIAAIQADESGCIDNNDKLKDIRIEAIGRLFSLETKVSPHLFLQAALRSYKDSEDFFMHINHMEQFLKEHAEKDDASVNARYYWIKRSLIAYNCVQDNQVRFDNTVHALSFILNIWSKMSHDRKQKIANYFLFVGPKIAIGLTYKFRGIHLGHNIRWPGILVDEDHIFEAGDTIDVASKSIVMRTLREALIICYSWSIYWETGIQTLSSKQRELMAKIMVHFIHQQGPKLQIELLPKVPARTFAKLEALQMEAKNIQAKVAENLYSKTKQFYCIAPKLNEIISEGNYLLQTDDPANWPQAAKDAYDWALERLAARVLSDKDLPPEHPLTDNVRDSMYI